MFELIDNSPEVSVSEAEYIRLLGYPRDYVLEGRPKELAHWAKEWYQEHGRPWIYARQAANVQSGSDGITVEGTKFTSKKLSHLFRDSEADGAYVVAVSAGEECEERARQLWLEEKPDEYFFLEMYGSAVVERLVASAAFRLCAWADPHNVAILPHYSPGYPGWDIADQHGLMNVILGGRQHLFPGKLQVLETGMLRPKKALLAMFGVTPHVERVRKLAGLVPCQTCSLPSCQYRRAPYRHAPPRIENLRTAKEAEGPQPTEQNNAESVLTQEANYSTSLYALKKWARERLSLTTRENGSVEAQFRYEGTTCSNLGRPLEFLYQIRLGPAHRGYRIEYAQCSPAPSDQGHKSMCEYISKGDSLLSDIAAERPLLGKQLEEILAWERPTNPSGCFCESTSRQHKWGLVYEVLHYALAHDTHSKLSETKKPKIPSSR